MELRYLGFDQLQNARGYRFDVIQKGDAPRRFVVTVDLALFREHRIGIQEGPRLCARKLVSDLENSAGGAHELTTDDLRAYADARASDEARKLESRKAGQRRPKRAMSDSRSPWHGPGR